MSQAGGVSTYRIQRSLAALTIHAQQALEEHKERRAMLLGGEMDQQHKIVLDGKVGDTAIWQDVEISFDNDFAPAADRRDSDFTEPLFTFGWERVKGPRAFVTAAVDKWIGDDSGTITGARIVIGLHRPGADEAKPFEYVVHTVFQGWANTEIDDDDMEGD